MRGGCTRGERSGGRRLRGSLEGRNGRLVRWLEIGSAVLVSTADMSLKRCLFLVSTLRRCRNEREDHFCFGQSIERSLTRSVAHSSIKRSSDDSNIKRRARMSQAFQMWKMGYSQNLLASSTSTIQAIYKNTPKVLIPENPKSVPHLFSNSSRSAADHVFSSSWLWL